MGVKVPFSFPHMIPSLFVSGWCFVFGLPILNIDASETAGRRIVGPHCIGLLIDQGSGGWRFRQDCADRTVRQWFWQYCTK